MVIFKNRWIKKFLETLKSHKKDLYPRYQDRMPSNIRLRDVVNVAKEGDLKEYFTAPHRKFTEPSTPEYYQASPYDGYYFFQDPMGTDYIACWAEMGNVAGIRRSQDIADAFYEYLDYHFMQLGAKPADTRFWKRQGSKY